MKQISSQLGGQTSSNDETLDELRKKFEKLDLPEETKTIVDKELKNLSRLKPHHHEYHNIETYLETLADLPWNKYDVETTDITHARKILDEDHYGLEKIKKRIIEFLAVRSLTKIKAILCFVGPPGVGKTSLGKSIARALGRKYYALALGGVKDEAMIRGFRRTYVGAQPGMIINSLKKVKTSNPVFLLDEID